VLRTRHLSPLRKALRGEGAWNRAVGAFASAVDGLVGVELGEAEHEVRGLADVGIARGRDAVGIEAGLDEVVGAIEDVAVDLEAQRADGFGEIVDGRDACECCAGGGEVVEFLLDVLALEPEAERGDGGGVFLGEVWEGAVAAGDGGEDVRFVVDDGVEGGWNLTSPGGWGVGGFRLRILDLGFWIGRRRRRLGRGMSRLVMCGVKGRKGWKERHVAPSAAYGGTSP
jgi:hypothetical protein